MFDNCEPHDLPIGHCIHCERDNLNKELADQYNQNEDLLCKKEAEIDLLTQQLAEANAHIERLRKALNPFVMFKHSESNWGYLDQNILIANQVLKSTPTQSLQEVKAQTIEEIKGEPVAWMLTKFGGFQPDDQQEYLYFVHIDDVDKYEPKLSEFIKHGLAVPLFDMQQLRQQGEK